MAISDDLNSIRTHLEDDYTALEQLGVSVEDRNIENIKDMANQIYAKFPKTNYAEGSNITLSNTLKGKLDYENDIVGIGDTYQYTTQGYQLLNFSDFTTTTNGVTITGKSGIITLNGKETSSISTNFAEMTISTTGNYTFYSNSSITTDNNPRILISVNGGNLESTYTPLTKSLSQGDTITFTIRTTSTSNTYSNVTLKPMVISGTDTTKSYEPYTGNSPSPNPSYPQDIEVVRGKNICNISIIGQVPSTSNGQLVTLAVGGCTDYTEIDNTKHYMFSYTGSSYMYVFLYKNDKTYIGYQQYTQGSYDISSITNYSQAKYVRIRTDNTSNVSEVQLEEGSIATSYLPYNTIEVKIQNKNLCTEMEQGDVSTSTGEASSYQPTTSGFIRSKDYIPVKPSEVITVSYKNTATSSIQIVIFEYNANKTYIGFYYRNASTYTRTLGNETAYIKIRLQDTTNTLSNNTEIQVEYGNTKTSYVEHQEQIKQLSLGEYEFAKIGNYVDTIEYDVDEDKVYKNKAIGKILLKDIPRGWAKSGYSTDEYFCGFTNFATSIKTNSYYMLCNKLINALYSDTTTSECIANDQESVNLKIKASRLSENSVDGFINYIENEGSDIYILYILKEAVTEEITDTTLKDQIKALYNSHSFTGTTIIEIDGQLPLIIKVSALKGE